MKNKINEKICSVCKRIVKSPIQWWESVDACSECVKKAAIESQEKNAKSVNEKWEEEFDEKSFHWFKFSQRLKLWFYPDKKVNSLKKEIKSFIRQLLEEQKQKTERDHKILVNTILDTKKRELQNYKQSLKEGCRHKWVISAFEQYQDMDGNYYCYVICEKCGEVKKEPIKLIDKKNE